MILKDLIAEPLPSQAAVGRAGAQVDSWGHAVEADIQPNGLVHLVLQMQPIFTMGFPLTVVQFCLNVFCHGLSSLRGSAAASFGAI